MFCEEYPRMTKELAIAFLFIPSVIFWGSGIMKDTYTFTAACWMTSSVYGLFLKLKKSILECCFRCILLLRDDINEAVRFRGFVAWYFRLDRI